MPRDIKTLKELNNGRKDYSKISGELSLPNLVEIQTSSYAEFKDKGLDEVFREAFPILSYSGTLSIDYVSCRLDQPKHTYLECKARDITYSAPIYAKLRLCHKETTGEIQESEVYMGEFPMMTSSGTFIINGAERVIVSQLVRSPGAYMSKEKRAGKDFYEACLMPGRGAWLQFETDSKDVLSVRIDRQRKIHATTLLRALGLETDEDIIGLFGKSEALTNTLAKDDDSNKTKNSRTALVDIFKKMKSGEPVTDDGIYKFIYQKFFDPKRYDLGRAGRFKFTKKLGIYNRLPGTILAENLISSDGEVRFEKDHLLTVEDVQALRNEDFFENGAHQKRIKVNERLNDDGIVNVVKVYANEKKEKKSIIVGNNLNSTCVHVTISDIYAVFSYFLNIQDGIGTTDDIDH